MEKVQILMSTYNGMNYLEKQLSSIEKQDYPNLEILIRDDGSSDDTWRFLKNYQQSHEHVKLMRGENIGAWRSFFVLMQEADEEADYYALSDQDDCWFADKISSAVHQIKKREIPMLYCSDKTIVDEKLRPIPVEISSAKSKKPSFGNALVENICTGCTCVLNKKMLELARISVPEYTIMHDWWLYLLATAYGEVIYDETSHMFYRKHANNTYGTIVKKEELWKHRMGELRKRRGEIYIQLECFRKKMCLNETQKELIDQVLDAKESLMGRVRLCLNRKIQKQERRSDCLYRAIVLIGKL